MPADPALPALLPDHPAEDGARARRLDAALRRYAEFFLGLSPATLDGFRALCTPDVHFRDPFNDVAGIDRMIEVFRSGFADTRSMRFELIDLARRGPRGFILWRMHFRPRRFGGSEDWRVEGVSEVQLTPEGKVAVHLDHWDSGAQFYARLPLIGWLIRLVRRRLQH